MVKGERSQFCALAAKAQHWGYFDDMPKIFTRAAAAKSLQSWPTLCDPIDGENSYLMTLCLSFLNI